MKSRAFCVFCILMTYFSSVYANRTDSIEMCEPFNFPLLLSGNFGELRSNHFHAGLDFKTQGASGKQILLPADGYISRVTVSPGGYGKAIYVVHDNGYMTVYGHLHKFPDNIAAIVRERQYRDETFAVDITFDSGEFPVKRGEVLALAGNSGYSFGPHLHFEVRVADGNELLNPMRFYKNKLSDTRPPQVQAVSVTPYLGRGVVEGGTSAVIRRLDGVTLRDTLEMWGTVGFAIKAKDVMDNTNNSYGVYSIKLYVDDSLRFSSNMDGYARNETRLINAWVDYERYIKKGDWFLRSYILENNPLRILHADANRGWLTIDDERVYNVEYRLADYHGNTTSCKFAVRGKKDTIPEISDLRGHYLYWFLNNEISYPGMRLKIPRGELFEHAFLNVTEEQQSALSRRYNLGGMRYPLRRKASLSLLVSDSLGLDSSKLYMKRITGKGSSAVNGKYSAGWLTSDITVLGCYEVGIDTVAPVVKSVNEKRWGRNGNIVFSVYDKETGIKEFKGTVDGSFVLFEYNSKSGRITCDLRKEKITRGRHTLRFYVIDNVGNMANVEKVIIY